MSFYNIICTLCDNIGCEYSTDAVLKNYTSFKIGGKADMMVFPDTEDKIASIFKAINENNIPCLIIGKGSNMLISDDGFRGVVINTCKFDNIKLIDDTTIYCQSGASLSKLCRFALDNSLTGLEFAFGIPGTCGGAAYMNAGAYGGEMKDVAVSALCLDEKLNIRLIEGEDMCLSYRSSIFKKKNLFIIGAYFKLTNDKKEDITARMDDYMGRRKSKQPLEYPSAGSVFKRPEGYFAGALIEKNGFKGYSVGGAQVSEKHAGFIINKGNATCSDVKKLVEIIKEKVLKEDGVSLQPELIFIGKDI
jgi:UDP-N-acetylmuramate dehydrogenase